MIQLKPVTKDNIGACVRLKVAEDQTTFVAPNINSIAWAYVAPELTPYGIYDGDTLVGFLSTEIIPDNEDYDRYWVPRFMIGADFQRKGYGRAGMMAAVEMLSNYEDCSRVRLSVVEENSAAIDFYKSIGFVLTDEYLEDERVMDYIFEGK
ncbi:GNAT family N-acetyltransferase [Chungangia koreensis]|uniref:GNAT family N-acetyltransferase n=1 Tax=Chungangia koreensis TaxID=752657 RepID=A0ABV8X7N2_9LACT